jgi:hypothetical protein
VAPTLLHHKLIGLSIGRPSSIINDRSQMKEVTLATTLYSALVDDLDIIGCFLADQEI